MSGMAAFSFRGNTGCDVDSAVNHRTLVVSVVGDDDSWSVAEVEQPRLNLLYENTV
jgi:hypothetical protein